MTEKSPVAEMAVEPSHKGKDPSTRTILIALVVLWVILFVGLLIFAWNAYFQQKDAAQTLAQQIAHACKSGDFGPGINQDDEDAMCSNAREVIKKGFKARPAEMVGTEPMEQTVLMAPQGRPARTGETARTAPTVPTD